MNEAAAGQAAGHPKPPIVTYAVIAVCVLIYLWELVNRPAAFGALVFGLEQTHWWTLLTSTLVHGSVMHIVFNMLAFLAMGRIVEWTIGSARFALLVLVTAWVSSFCQLYIENIPGVGLSGVAYGVFGFIVGASPANNYFRWFVKQNALMLIGWAVLCVVLTQEKVLGVANTAHFSGLIYGAVCGLIYGLPKYRIPFGILSALILVATIFLLPGLHSRLG